MLVLNVQHPHVRMLDDLDFREELERPLHAVVQPPLPPPPPPPQPTPLPSQTAAASQAAAPTAPSLGHPAPAPAHDDGINWDVICAPLEDRAICTPLEVQLALPALMPPAAEAPAMSQPVQQSCWWWEGQYLSGLADTFVDSNIPDFTPEPAAAVHQQWGLHGVEEPAMNQPEAFELIDFEKVEKIEQKLENRFRDPMYPHFKPLLRTTQESNFDRAFRSDPYCSWILTEIEKIRKQASQQGAC